MTLGQVFEVLNVFDYARINRQTYILFIEMKKLNYYLELVYFKTKVFVSIYFNFDVQNVRKCSSHSLFLFIFIYFLVDF